MNSHTQLDSRVAPNHCSGGERAPSRSYKPTCSWLWEESYELAMPLESLVPRRPGNNARIQHQRARPRVIQIALCGNSFPLEHRSLLAKPGNTLAFLYALCEADSHLQLFATPWTVACQAPQSMDFSRQEYWSGLPLLSPGDLPNPRIEPRSLSLQADFFTIWATKEAPLIKGCNIILVLFKVNTSFFNVEER